MDTIFINSGNSKKTNDGSGKLVLDIFNTMDLSGAQRYVSLSNLSIYYTWRNITKNYNNGKFKINTPTWKEEFTLPDGSYSISDIDEYFQLIFNKHKTKKTVFIYADSVENRVTFKIEEGSSLELLTDETKKLLGSEKSKIESNKNGENPPQLEIADVVLVHCNLVDNQYQLNSKILHSFVPDKPFGHLLNITPPHLIKARVLKSKFNTIEVWFTDQDIKPLKIEDRVSVTLVIE